MLNNYKILVVGLGLIGGSIAMALRQSNIDFTGYDIDEATLNYAYEINLIERTNKNIESLIEESEIIILSLYPNATITWVNRYQHLFNEKTLIIETTGVKFELLANLQAKIVKGELYAIHPMAGKEQGGIKNASKDLFNNANLIVTPTSFNTTRSNEVVKELARILKFKNFEVLSPKEHDKMISYLSQLPHVLAVALMNMRDSTHLHVYSGDSFKDLTRIAKINENLWTELFLLNKDCLIDDLNLFIETIEKIRTYILEDKVEELIKLFIESTARRKAFDV